MITIIVVKVELLDKLLAFLIKVVIKLIIE
jgi:hypothetical protein